MLWSCVIGGAGGKGVWGKPGSELNETGVCSDVRDPNYDSDSQVICPLWTLCECHYTWIMGWHNLLSLVCSLWLWIIDVKSKGFVLSCLQNHGTSKLQHLLFVFVIKLIERCIYQLHHTVKFEKKN